MLEILLECGLLHFYDISADWQVSGVESASQQFHLCNVLTTGSQVTRLEGKVLVRQWRSLTQNSLLKFFFLLIHGLQGPC